MKTTIDEAAAMPGMNERAWRPLAGDAPPRFAPAAGEDLLLGGRNLRRAFLLKPMRRVDRNAKLFDPRQHDPEVLLIANGFAHRSCAMADGSRAILDILTIGDVVGLDHVVLAGPLDKFVASSPLSYRALPASELRQLMAADPPLALHVCALLAEARWRAARLAIGLGRLDAHARICLLLLDVYDRLRRRGLINGQTYNLPLTQEEIADHLGLTIVHVNRTLRRLREEGVVIVDRQVVLIRDLARMRELSKGLSPFPELRAGDRGGDDAGFGRGPISELC